MKKIILALTVLLSNLYVNAQQFQGKAEYFSKRFVKKESDDTTTQTEKEAEYKKTFEEALKKSSEKIFVLTFNKKEALYEEQKTIDPPKPKKAGLTITLAYSGEGKKYINLQDKIAIVEDDIVGKEFLIVDSLQSFQWKLVDGLKKIGDYKCNKAELIIPVSANEKKEYEDYMRMRETKSSLLAMDEPQPKKITAWYTPDIPVSFGPLNYWGLPGLILELNDGEVMVLCSKVVLSNKENTKIKIPDAGKKVNREEFDAIHRDKMESINNQQ